MKAIQMTNFDNNNGCSVLPLTNAMGLDVAPVKFFTLVFLRLPTDHILKVTVLWGRFFMSKVKVW